MRLGGKHLVIATATSLLAACALTPEQKLALVEQRQARVQSLEDEVVAEMKEVVSQVKADDFKQCIERLHSPNFWGGEYRAVGEFIPNPAFSCVVQGRGEALTKAVRGDDGTKYAVFTVPMRKVGGGFGSGSTRLTAHCVFKSEKGRLSFVGGNHEMKTHKGNSCRILL